jgi:hypothetical protein
MGTRYKSCTHLFLYIWGRCCRLYCDPCLLPGIHASAAVFPGCEIDGAGIDQPIRHTYPLPSWASRSPAATASGKPAAACSCIHARHVHTWITFLHCRLTTQTRPCVQSVSLNVSPPTSHGCDCHNLQRLQLGPPLLRTARALGATDTPVLLPCCSGTLRQMLAVAMVAAVGAAAMPITRCSAHTPTNGPARDLAHGTLQEALADRRPT